MTTEIKKIEVGTLATGSYWSDCYPFEVIKVSPSGKTITIRCLDTKLISGSDFDGTAEYEYMSNEHAATYTVRLIKRGYRTPCNMRIAFGHARAYRDPHF
jgi:hypothetical protein